MSIPTTVSAPRLNYAETAPDVLRALLAFSNTKLDPGLEPALLELVRLRASQLNGCAFCIAMHVDDARRHGEDERRLHLLSAWEEVDCYTPRECAALKWTEHLTKLAGNGVPEAVFEEVRAHFSESELVSLSLTIAIINTWNRMNVGFRIPPRN